MFQGAYKSRNELFMFQGAYKSQDALFICLHLTRGKLSFKLYVIDTIRVYIDYNHTL